MAADAAVSGRRALAALLFIQSATMTLDAYSTFESSPWTAESFGGDNGKMKSAREYLKHAVGYSMSYALASSAIAGSPMPVLGAAVSNAYLVWLYERAFRRGQASGSVGWGSGEDRGLKQAMWKWPQ